MQSQQGQQYCRCTTTQPLWRILTSLFTGKLCFQANDCYNESGLVLHQRFPAPRASPSATRARGRASLPASINRLNPPWTSPRESSITSTARGARAHEYSQSYKLFLLVTSSQLWVTNPPWGFHTLCRAPLHFYFCYSGSDRLFFSGFQCTQRIEKLLFCHISLMALPGGQSTSCLSQRE